MRIFCPRMSTIIYDVESRNIVGPLVRQARLAARPKLTQKELVARLQVLGIIIDQSGLSKIENGQRPVSDIEVAILAKALKVPVAW
jgi:transcriptional regulator with XRE-family HTH domain